jgi:hypothetical protein
VLKLEHAAGTILAPRPVTVMSITANDVVHAHSPVKTISISELSAETQTPPKLPRCRS